MAKKRTVSTNGLSIPEWEMVRPDLKPFKNSKGITKDYERLKREALFFIHYEVSDKLVATEFHKYCQTHFDKKLAVLVKKLPDYHFSTAGKYAYLAAKGGVINEQEENYIKECFEKYIDKAKKLDKEKKIAEKEKPSAPVISIQDRMKEQVFPLCGMWDGLLDELCADNYDIKKFDPYSNMKAFSDAEIKPAHAKIIKDLYEAEYAEALEVVEWKDDDIKEGYYFLNTAQKRKTFALFFEKIFTACDTIINTGKSTRKTRKPKAVSREKIVAKLKYKQSEPTLGLASINPVAILDAHTLWVYNTKNRKLGVYMSDGMVPLSVKGTTILHFTESKSIQKTVRKPEELLKGADKLAKTKFQKLFDEINAVGTKMNGRINEHTILIKVFD